MLREKPEVTDITTTNQISPEDFIEITSFIVKATESDPHNLSRISEAALERELQTGCVFVAKQEGRIVGTVRAIPIAGYRVISTTYVDPDFQGRGIGQQLLSKVIEAYPNDKFYLETQNPSMVKLATRLDFKIVPARQVLPVLVASNWQQMAADPRAYFKGMLSGPASDSSTSNYVFMVRYPTLDPSNES